jgi:hypothetical protein
MDDAGCQSILISQENAALLVMSQQIFAALKGVFLSISTDKGTQRDAHLLSNKSHLLSVEWRLPPGAAHPTAQAGYGLPGVETTPVRIVLQLYSVYGVQQY